MKTLSLFLAAAVALAATAAAQPPGLRLAAPQQADRTALLPEDSALVPEPTEAPRALPPVLLPFRPATTRLTFTSTVGATPGAPSSFNPAAGLATGLAEIRTDAGSLWVPFSTLHPATTPTSRATATYQISGGD